MPTEFTKFVRVDSLASNIEKNQYNQYTVAP